MLNYEPFFPENTENSKNKTDKLPFTPALNWRLAHYYANEGHIIHGDRFFSSAKTALALK